LYINQHDYQKYLLGDKGGRFVELTNLSPSCTDCLEILGALTFWNPKGFSRPVQGWLHLYSMWGVL